MSSALCVQIVNPYTYEVVQKFAETILSRTVHRPKIGIICGSGLGGLADAFDEKQCVDYGDVPNFPVSTVLGHVGRFVFGKLRGKPCVCMQGRFHVYEGYSAHTVTLPVRVMRLMGVEILIVTNAAGGLNSTYNVGDIMLIKDHIFLPGFPAANSPLLGPNDERFGPRFPAVSAAYDKELRRIARVAAADPAVNIVDFLREGVYVNSGGPSYETIVESKLMVALGADVIGMSTAPEVIVAVHCGMRVCGLSLVTNQVVLDYEEIRLTNHEEVLETGRLRGADMQRLVAKMVELFPVEQS